MAELRVGVAVSDANRADRPHSLRVPEDLPTYARRYREVLGSNEVVLELQPEERFVVPVGFPDEFRPRPANRWMRVAERSRDFHHLLTTSRTYLGVHMPVGGIDTLSSNFFGKYSALEEARRAMDLADRVGAEYFVVHLAQRDKWEWARSDQIAKALKIYKELAAYYSFHKYTFVPCIEVLEYPKFPATGGELIYIYNECRRILPETRIAFNLSHLWRSRNLMLTTGVWGKPDVSFIDHLEYSLSQLWQDIHVFQLGGCWETETHCVPGLHPQQNPFQHPMKLHESVGVYDESGEVNLNATLDLLLDYTIEYGRDLNLILEIHDRNLDQILEAARIIRSDLADRLEERRHTSPSDGTGGEVG
ncbi:MAG: hypothetical protein M5U01_02855 [Ardenticatenaceae bacterium]|nr:hypothetical protein [Ardenticatenaceae bacterium]HBY93623.1 hypothetical protein [Chloroflexota bacterium]